MADTEEQPQQSIQARIAALNLGQVGRAPVTAKPAKPPRPDPPARPPLNYHSKSAHTPNVGIREDGVGTEPAERPKIQPAPVGIIRTGQVTAAPKSSTPPRLPERKPSGQVPQISPALPPRRPSNQLVRRDSRESIASVKSSLSINSYSASRRPSHDGTRMQAPAYDPVNLPPLPPKRTQVEKDEEAGRIPLKGTKSAHNIKPPVSSVTNKPPLPRRAATNDFCPAQPPRKLPPTIIPPMPARPIPPPSPVSTATRLSGTSAVPPPVPLGSRPDLSKLLATKPKLSPAAAQHSSLSASLDSCLKCRDFSQVDSHAAQFLRHSVPSLDWLATKLTQPFPSPTDKARALFTWLHHNIDYNTQAFFSGNVKSSTPASTLDSGLAVCEGYAGLFTALATKAGLESVVVVGHGKGYGSAPIPLGQPTPPETSNHAWNVVKIDNGEWKLIDSCWGAGDVKGHNLPYNRNFKPQFFTMDNNEFGLKHFPTNRNQQYRLDGRVISWEEYILADQGAEGVLVFSDVALTEGFACDKFLPKLKAVSNSPSAYTGPTVRFQFQRTCEHWDPMHHGPGKPYLYFLSFIPKDGSNRGDEMVPFDDNGMFWWVDIPLEKLGKKGDTLQICCMDNVNGNSARGLTKEEYLVRKPEFRSWAWKGMASWDII